MRHAGLKKYFILRLAQRPGALRDFLNMLGPDDDIARFEYLKKSARNFGSILIGIETKAPENFTALKKAFDAAGMRYQDITDNHGNVVGVAYVHAANEITVQKGVYPYVQPVWLYARAKSANAAIERFLQFVRSKPGPRGRADPSGEAGETVPRQPLVAARLGVRQGLCGVHVAHPSEREAG